MLVTLQNSFQVKIRFNFLIGQDVDPPPLSGHAFFKIIFCAPLLTIELLVDDLVSEEATTDELEDLSSEDEAEVEEEENRLLE